MRGNSSSQLIIPDDLSSQCRSDSAYVLYSEDSTRSSASSVESDQQSNGRGRTSGGYSGSMADTREDSFAELREALLES